MFQEHMQSLMRMRKNVGKDQMVEAGRRQIVRSLPGKDKHSKICTSKGSRDRRIRLSANTAIQFYDVQDRLGFDRPSNAIDWLMKEAKAAIDVLNDDHYHHLQELLLPDAATSIFNLSEAFHRTPSDPLLQNLNQDQIHGFNKSQFDIMNSRNRCQSQDTDFPSSTIRPNYNELEGFEFVNSSFQPTVIDHLKINQIYGLPGISFEEDNQVEEAENRKQEDGRSYLYQ